MDNITLYNATKKYYNKLFSVGKSSINDACKILIMSELKYMLENYTAYLTYEDQCAINKCISCLNGGSCVFPYTK